MVETKMRSIRKSKGITVAFVARQLGITARHYWKIETAYRGMRPSVKVLAKVSNVLGVPMEALVEVEE